MAAASVFDVIVVGGGVAGSALAGVLARAELGVLVVEKEPRFRDRVRGECTWPWGVAEARRSGLDEVLARAGAVPFTARKHYEHRRPVDTAWECTTAADVPGLSFSHPRLQEAAFAWAQEQGATALRPAKATRFSRNGSPALTVQTEGGEVEYRARLIVGADGKRSAARRWTGGESVADPEHHRMGGVLMAGVASNRQWLNIARADCEAIAWLAAGAELTRAYIIMSAERLRQTGVDRSFAAIVAYLAELMPEGALADARQAGPIGFFANGDTWASRIAGNGVVLIGDAAGAPDPTEGHGTPLLFRDVRTLSELLLSTADWDAATAEFADGRRRAYAVVRAWDRWSTVFFDPSEEAARLRDGHERAKQHDPTLGGFAQFDTRGPGGLVADEAARRRFFGLDLA